MITTLTGTKSSYKLTNYGADVLHSGPIKNMFKGKVVLIGAFGSIISVVVQSSHFELIRYSNIYKVAVSLNQILEPGDLIGYVKGKVIVEYCTSFQDDSFAPVRVYDRTFYKQSIKDILEERYELQYQEDVWYAPPPSGPAEFTEEQRKEFFNCRGDNIVEFGIGGVC